MATVRYRDEDSRAGDVLFVALGAAAGLVAGLYIADRYGGFSALTGKLRERLDALDDRVGEYDESLDDDDVAYAVSPEQQELDELEVRVLEAFRNDPILSARAIDISAATAGTIELTGRVRSAEEVTHATTLARGIPGVADVTNRLHVRTRRAGGSRQPRADSDVAVVRDATAESPRAE